MARCTNCGRHGLFMKVDSVFGLCERCLAIEAARHEQEAIAFEMLSKAKSEATIANKSRNFGEFVVLFDDILECLKKASDIERDIPYFKSINGSPSADYRKLLKEKQWHYRDAIERNYSEIEKNAKGLYRNNKKATIIACEELKSTIDAYKNTFDDETNEFAKEILKKMSLKFGINIDNHYDNQHPSTLIDFDYLDGHDFEYWCADTMQMLFIGYWQYSCSRNNSRKGIL